MDFSYRIRPGDAVSVYPVFESFDIASVSRVRPVPLRDLRFVLDVHLGRLAVQRQLFLRVDDNYFSPSTTITL
jgi:hypothetical protein